MTRIALAAVVAALACTAPVGPAVVQPPTAQPPPQQPMPPTEPTQPTPAELARDAARTPLATQVVDAYSNARSVDAGFAARWSPDGAHVLFASDRSGATQIYAGLPAHPDAPPIALTSGEQRATVAQYTHDGRSVIFLRDTGADDNYAIWRVDADGAHTTNLTPGDAMHRAEPILPLHAPDLMLYSAAKTTAPDTMLFRQDLAGGEPVQIFSQPMPGTLVDATADGKHALMAEFHADDDIVLTEVDVANGHARRVFPRAGTHAGMYTAQYAADGSRLFIATDRPDGVVLLAMDPATGAELATYRDALPRSALSVLASPTGDVLALGVDAGTHGEVRILDAHTLAVRRTIAAPLGEIYLGAFRPDGAAFSVSISQPQQPDDPYAVDVATGALAPLRSDPRPGLATLPPLDVSIATTTAFDGLTIPINVYLPKHAAGARLPVIASFHGGPSASSEIHWLPSLRFYTALGYAVIEPNVRGSTGFGRAYEMADNREKRADWLRDLETVNTWVKAQPWCDPDRVAISGASYGGYTTLMALTRFPTAWRAGIDAFGPANLRTFLLSTDAMVRAGFVPEFGDVDKDAALIEQFSPMREVANIVRPLFVYAGQNDPLVPRSESDALVAALRARQVHVEYVVAPNEGHSLDRRDNRIQVLVRIARFLEDAMP